MGTDKSCGPPSFSGPFEVFEAFWWLLAPLGGFLGLRFPARALVWGAQLGGPFAGCVGATPLARPWPLAWGALGLGALGEGGPWPGRPWPGGALARRALALGVGRPWSLLVGGPLGPWSLAPRGPGGRALGAFGGEPLIPACLEKITKACLDPSPASWSRNPATRGQGAPGKGGGGPQTLNPKP